MFRARAIALLTTTAALATTPAYALTTVRLDGIGPLKLGMSTSAALKTKWLSGKQKGCELASPRPTTYEFHGTKAPKGISGFAEFTSGKLTNLSFSAGVRTGKGTIPGRSSLAGMKKVYGQSPFSATSTFEDTFGGTFVNVKRAGDLVLSGFGTGKKVQVLGVPSVPSCE